MGNYFWGIKRCFHAQEVGTASRVVNLHFSALQRDIWLPAQQNVAMLWKNALGDWDKEILSSSVDWEKHLCSYTETVAFKRQCSRGPPSYGSVALADFSLEY